MTSRRRFLESTAALVALSPALAKGQGATEPAADAAIAPSDALTSDSVACAERLAGVAYTESERAQVAEAIESQLDAIRLRRSLDMGPEDGPPACTFSPLLPGRSVPHDKARWQPRPDQVPAVPANHEDVAFAPLAHLSAWLRTGQLSSLGLTELYLERIRRHAPALECVVTVTEALAREQAEAADREIRSGHVRGPLHGIPWAAKDLFDTRGIATTWGATPYRNRVPDRDAMVVERLREAGAVLIAKTSLGAIAYGDVWFGGKTRNPWNPAEGSSGSSAGSAVCAAAGLAGFTLGTETYGSIVSPATRCGATGLRPTFGRVSRAGAMALCWSLDKIGPLTRSVADAAAVLHAIAGPDVRDPDCLDAPFGFDAGAGAAGLRVGYVPAWFESEDALESDRAALAATRDAGAVLVPIELPDLPYPALLPILYAEAAAAFESLTLSDRDDLLVRQDDRAWPNLWRRARFVSAVDFVQAQRFRRQVMVSFDALFTDLDAIISPTFGNPLLLATNFTGHPALTLRAGFRLLPARDGDDGDGPVATVPHSVTLWGPLFGEDRLCRLGMALESRLGVWDRRPPLAA